MQSVQWNNIFPSIQITAYKWQPFTFTSNVVGKWRNKIKLAGWMYKMLITHAAHTFVTWSLWSLIVVPLETSHSHSSRKWLSGLKVVWCVILATIYLSACFHHYMCFSDVVVVQLFVTLVMQLFLMVGRGKDSHALTYTQLMARHQLTERTWDVTLQVDRASHTATTLPFCWQWQNLQHCPFNTVQLVEWNWEKAPRTVPLSRRFTQPLSILCHRVRFGRT